MIECEEIQGGGIGSEEFRPEENHFLKKEGPLALLVSGLVVCGVCGSGGWSAGPLSALCAARMRSVWSGENRMAVTRTRARVDRCLPNMYSHSTFRTYYKAINTFT